ncbi:MAG: PEGA domain-containing protein, partial [Labilithrix sp.]|nr:PEGA domain-containing protein [Labilithrix sp.]
VTMNGKALGDTPLVRVQLPPGTHTLVLENAAEKIRQTTVVTIKAGESVSRRLAF